MLEMTFQEETSPPSGKEDATVGLRSNSKRPVPPARLNKAGGCRGLRLRIYPTPEQEVKLRRVIGASRFIWNWALGEQQASYRATEKHTSTEELSRALTVLMKTDVDRAWLQEIPRTALTQTLNHLKSSWADFFDGCQGKRPDKPGPPRFRARGGAKESATFQVDPRHKCKLDMVKRELHLAGIGWVPVALSEKMHGQVSSITVENKGGVWFASLALVKVPAEKLIRKPHLTKQFEDPLDPQGMVAMDASVVHGAVVSNDGATSWKMSAEQLRARNDKRQTRKKRYQRQQANKNNHRLMEMGMDPKKPIPKGTRIIKSRRQEKLDLRIAGIDLKMLFARRDMIHKFTTGLVRNHHTIVVETLALKAMSKGLSRGFRRRFHEACMGEILRQLKYKCQWFNRKLILVDRWFPSSKRCSNPSCHKKNTLLRLKDRAWTCPHCQTFHDRDENAAINLWQEGWRLLLQASTDCPTVGSTDEARRAECATSTVSGLKHSTQAVRRDPSQRRAKRPAQTLA